MEHLSNCDIKVVGGGQLFCLLLVDYLQKGFHYEVTILFRLSSAELLKLPFFKKAKNKEFIKEVVLGDAPSLQSRAKRVKL